MPYVWEAVKILIVPLCLYVLERQIAKRDDKREKEYTQRKQQNDDIQFLMMQRLDKLSELTHLMAQKLHDQGIINGDLEELDKKYKKLDEDYEKEVRRLAFAYSKR